MMPRRGTAAKKHHARLAWLTARPEAYAPVPGIRDDVTPAGRAALDGLRQQMVEAGLLGTHAPDSQRETIRRIVSELRGEAVGVGAW